MNAIEAAAVAARAASYPLAACLTQQKNAVLESMAAGIRARRDDILAANRADVAAAHEQGLEAALIDRLSLGEKSVEAMATGVETVASLPDPVGEVTGVVRRPSGIAVGKMRVPLGVVAIIYEARPNVTADAASLCLKSGNAALLRGGSEARRSNRVIAEIISNAVAAAALPPAAIQVLTDADRAAVGELIKLRQYIDVLIPRGGKGLISRLRDEARIPMIQHLDGNCHVYVHSRADLAQALAIVDNAKTQRYGTCNTAESLLCDEAVAATFLPLIAAVFRQKGVAMRGCPATMALIADATPASEADFYSEYLAPIISIKVVADLDAAIAHINTYSSHHTDAIVSQDHSAVWRFLREVDSSSVMVNASTRFADGFEYGLGAEIGISTDKIHARGPVGLHGLTSEKWIVLGQGELRR